MDYLFKAPSKTFLVGEYAVLKGGTALVLNTDPLFQMSVSASVENDCKGIHPLSPAGKWLRSRAVFFKGLKIEFIDPWQERGGYGASSAQFLFMHALSSLLNGQAPFADSERYIHQLISDFHSLYDNESGFLPSGVDLISQYLGGVSAINEDRTKSVAISWPFTFKNFLIFKTGYKVKSHEHLSDIHDENLLPLIEISKKSQFLFQNAEWSAFVESIKSYQQQLIVNKWTCEKSIELINQIKSWPEVEVVKGCGAQGADTIVLLCDDSLSIGLKEKCRGLGLEYVADKMNLSRGFGFEAINKLKSTNSEFKFTNFNEEMEATFGDREL